MKQNPPVTEYELYGRKKKLSESDMLDYLGTSDGIGYTDRLECMRHICDDRCPYFQDEKFWQKPDDWCKIGALWQEPEPPEWW
jgi:hypothetical protein